MPDMDAFGDPVGITVIRSRYGFCVLRLAYDGSKPCNMNLCRPLQNYGSDSGDDDIGHIIGRDVYRWLVKTVRRQSRSSGQIIINIYLNALMRKAAEVKVLAGNAN